MIGNHQIDAKFPRTERGLRRADPAIDGDHEARAARSQAFHGSGLQAISVAQAVGHEMFDLAAHQLDGASEDHGGGDSVGVVVTVDDDPLTARHGPEDALHRHAHVRQQKRVVQLAQVGRQEQPGGVRIVESALAQQASDDEGHAQGGRRPFDVAVVGGHVFPDAALHQLPWTGAPSSTNA